MSMMEQMLGNMLKQALPPEIMAMLTQEKLNEYGEKVNAFLIMQRETLASVVSSQAEILERLERIENDGRNNSGRGRKLALTDGSGNDGGSTSGSD